MSEIKGFVYILINSSLPGMVKIGMTEKDPVDRAAQLSTTAIPHPFEVYGYVEVADCKRLEKQMHRKLKSKRISRKREFFKVSPEYALKLLEKTSGKLEILRAKEVQRKLEEDAYNKKRNEQKKIKEKEQRMQMMYYKIYNEELEKTYFKDFDQLQLFSEITGYFVGICWFFVNWLFVKQETLATALMYGMFAQAFFVLVFHQAKQAIIKRCKNEADNILSMQCRIGSQPSSTENNISQPSTTENIIKPFMFNYKGYQVRHNNVNYWIDGKKFKSPDEVKKYIDFLLGED